MSANLPAHRRTARMRLVFLRLAAVAAVIVACAWAAMHDAPCAHAGNLVENFDGPANSRPDPRLWSYDIGGGGWGNQEIQTYTDKANNARLDGNGHLVIAAVRQPGGGYTSARLTTNGKFSFTAGRAEARIKVPRGDGLHAGFWLMGDDLEQVGWPRSGEIDVMETINDADTYNCALHGPDTANSVSGWQAGESLATPAPLSDDFHTYWVQRSPGSMTIGIDDSTVCNFTADSVGAGHQWVFDKPFHLLLNLSVGGNYAGPPSAQTPSPAAMLVDWVRVTG